MKNVVVLLAGLAILAGLQAQPVTGISGTVINAENRQPIVGATVCCYVANAQTDSAGAYLIGSLQPGKYRVRAFATGFQMAYYPESVLVVHGQVTPDINFALVPTGSPTGGISGRVTNASNQLPIHGATITAQGPNGTGTAQSESCGGYLINGLPAGKYRVCAQAQGFEPGVFPESVLVVGGQVTPNIAFALVPTGGQTGGISGRIFDASTQAPIRGAIVTAQGPNGHGSAQTESCGGYIINGLPAGKYRVCAQARGYEPGAYPESVLVTEGRVTPSINFHLVPTGGQTGGISGFVTNARTREPIFGALVVAAGPSRGSANTCQRGGYAIRDLLPGVYAVQATARGFEPSPVETVTVVAGQITPNVDFALEPEGGGGSGGISGIVTDSSHQNRIVGANIFAWGPAGQGSTVSDTDGSYLVQNLRPGAYVVRACARGYYPATYPESVGVVAGQTTPSINFHLRRVGDLDAGIGGFVYDGYAQIEIAGARVTAIGVSGSYETFADAQGDYLFDNLAPGEYELEVAAEGYESGLYSEPVVVESDAITAFISPAVYPLTGVAEPGPQSRRTEMSLRVGPNPFSGRALIQWQVRMPGRVAVRVFDNAGRTARTIQDGELSTGFHAAIWDGTNDLGQKVANGIYFCRLDASGVSELTKVVLLNR